MKIAAIAFNMFREAVRDKVLFNLLFFALLMIACAGLGGMLSAGERARVITDIGLAAMNLFGVLIAIFLGVSLVGKEIDRRTIYNILSKPVRRHTFLLGKYLGLALTLLVNLLVMVAVFMLILKLMEEPIHPTVIVPIVMIYLELLVVIAISLFFSTFSTMTLSAIFTLGLYLVGHLSELLRTLTEKGTLPVQWLGKALYYLLPNLETFNYKQHASHLLTVPDGQIAFSLSYGLFYIVFLLALSVWSFQGREFK